MKSELCWGVPYIFYKELSTVLVPIVSESTGGLVFWSNYPYCASSL